MVVDTKLLFGHVMKNDHFQLEGNFPLFSRLLKLKLFNYLKLVKLLIRLWLQFDLILPARE